MLEDSEDAHQKAESHSEPDEAAPVAKRPESLNGKKENDQVGQEQQKFDSCVVRRRGTVKKPLAQNNEGERRQRRQQGRKNGLLFGVEKDPQCPDEKEQTGAGLDHRAGPIFDTAVRGNCKHQQRANANAQHLHGLECSAGSGTKATSSTQAVP